MSLCSGPEFAEVKQRQIGRIGRAVLGRHIGVEQLHAHRVGGIGLEARDEAWQVAGDTLVGVEAEHPVMRQLGPRHFEQEPSMPPLSELPRGDVLLPRLVDDDQGDLGMLAQDVDGIVGARIVIGDDGIDLASEIVERVGKDQRLVADARHRHEPMLAPEQHLVALDDLLGFAELPVGRGRRHIARVRGQNPNLAKSAAIQISAASAMAKNTAAEPRSFVTRIAACNSGCT